MFAFAVQDVARHDFLTGVATESVVTAYGDRPLKNTAGFGGI